MLTDAQKAVLTEEELEHYEYLSDDFDEESQQTYVSLADARIESEARRKMLKDNQYQYYHNKQDESEGYYCIECGVIEGLDCKPDCAYALLAEEE